MSTSFPREAAGLSPDSATHGQTPPPVSALRTFGRLMRAEWTKLRTVRGWMAALLGGVAAMIALGLMTGAQGSCTPQRCAQPTGPDGQEVTDAFSFAHQPLTGDGSITVRVAEMDGLIPADPGTEAEDAGQGPQRADGPPSGMPGLAPWAKTGLMIKDGTRPGAAYAAIMTTGSHGVRMQHNFTHDRAGTSGNAPRWLRLTRTGELIVGEESADGHAWTKVGEVRLNGLPATVQAGMFATSPQYSRVDDGLIGTAASGGPSQVTGAFDHLELEGDWPAAAWTGTKIGGPIDRDVSGFGLTGPVFRVTGSGDVAPATAGLAGIGVTITQTLVGTFVALIAVVVLGAVVMTAEFRRGLVRTTLAAAPRRGRVLAAKAVVLGGVTFLVGLVAAVLVVEIGGRVMVSRGVYVHPVTTGIRTQVVVGTAALLAFSAVLAMALGTVLRRSLTAVTTGIVLIVLPYLLSLTALSGEAADWVLRVTPAAAFALQQSRPAYPQVDNLYTAALGYFPLPPWGGFSVLVAWTTAALVVAAVALRRRDA
ncbi:ABC transporter permease subunit [Actinoplanes sp. NPDC024001]|uniref:ABC transporter permease subunit n=1 Tax=Actinoplanes sp. NPDC024001 TaxID=3154598 RepID=UPI0033ED0EE2